MVCNSYIPKFQDQINSYDYLGSLSCTCYSGAMAGDYHTCGAKKPTGKAVRYYTGDRIGGTSLPQVDYALNRGWGINLDTRIGSSRLTWSQFVNAINSGRGAILQGSYRAIHGTKFAGDLNFTGNHAVFVPPGWKVMDPLCDGRRAGIYKYHGEVYPRDMLRRFAGYLELSPGGPRAGLGYAWCSLTRDNKITYKARVPEGTFTKYHVVDGIITVKRVYETGGFSAMCTAPRLYPARDGLGFANRSLVKLTTGGREGAYISSKWSKEI